MIEATQQELAKKYNSLSGKLRDFLDSSQDFELIRKILKKYGLSDDDVEVLTSGVGYVLLGFIKPQELFQKTNEYLEADEKIVVEVIREINRQILYPLHNELEKLYKLETHIEEVLEKKQIQPIIEIKKEAPKPPVEVEQKIQVETKIPKITKPVEEGKPFILHEEKPVAEGKKTITRPFSLPFKIFSSRSKPESPSPVKARVEEPERIVHYSESRTPLEPFGKEEEIINLETFQTETEQSKPEPKPERKPEQKPETKPEESPPQPKLEGNVVDLR